MSAKPRSREIRQVTRVKKLLTPADEKLLVAIARDDLAGVIQAVEKEGADVNCISYHQALGKDCSAVYIAFKEHRGNDRLMDYLIKVKQAEPRNQAERDEMDLYYRLMKQRERAEAKAPPLPASAPPPPPTFAPPSSSSSPPPLPSSRPPLPPLPPLPSPPVKTETKVSVLPASPSSPIPPPPSQPLPPLPPLPGAAALLSPLPEEQKLAFQMPEVVSVDPMVSAQRGLSVDVPTYLEPNPLSAEIRAGLSAEMIASIEQRRALEVIFIRITNNDNCLPLFMNKSPEEIAAQVNVLGFVKFPDTSNRPQDLGNGPIKLLNPLQFAMTRNPVNRDLLTFLIIRKADLSRLNDFELCQLYESFLVLGNSISAEQTHALMFVHQEFDRRRQEPMPADAEEQTNRKHMLIRVAIYQNEQPDNLRHLLMPETSRFFEEPSPDIHLGYPTETIGLDGSRVQSNDILDVLSKRREYASPFIVWTVLKALGKFDGGETVLPEQAIMIRDYYLAPNIRSGSKIQLPQRLAQDLVALCQRSGASRMESLSTAVASLPKETPLHANVPGDEKFKRAVESKMYPFDLRNENGFTPLEQQIKNALSENVKAILKHGPPLSQSKIKSLLGLVKEEIEALQKFSFGGLVGSKRDEKERRLRNLKDIVKALEAVQLKVVDQKADRPISESKRAGVGGVGAGGVAAAPGVHPGGQQFLGAVQAVMAPPAAQPYSSPAAPKTREGEAKKGLAAAAAARAAESGPPRSPSRSSSSMSHAPAGPVAPSPPPLPTNPPNPRTPAGGGGKK